MRYVQLPASVFTANRVRLIEKLPEKSLAILNANDVMPTNADGTLGFTQNSDLYYLTGIDQEDTILMLCPNARDPKYREVLFVRETSELLAIWEGAKLTKAEARKVSGIESVYWLSEFEQILRDLMFEADAVYLNLNEHLRSSSQVQTRDARFVEELRRRFPLHQFARLAPILYRLRMIKSAEEIDAIREATTITDAGFRRLLGFVKPGVTEYEIEAELAHEYIRSRSRGFSYPPIIASGANACVLHYVENNATCQDGEMLLLDVAAEYANYHSDMTRTIPVNGRFTERQKQVYNAVLRVLRACSSMLRPGVMPQEYQKAVNKMMESELIGLGLLDTEAVKNQDPDQPLYRQYFMHGVSHHIGIDVHDVHDAAFPYAEGMILTVEPGIYIREEGLAVRLENLILIGKDGNQDLMEHVPIEVEEIEFHMQKR